MELRVIFLGLAIVIGVLGSALLVAFGLLYLRPYVKVRHFEKALCTVTSADFFLDDMIYCKCISCTAKYPCCRIYVNLTTASEEHLNENVTLYDKYETYQLQATNKQCSFHSCHKSGKRNTEEMFKFLKEFGNLGQQYECFYSPLEGGTAIINVVSLSTVIHLLVWPSLAIIIGILLLLYSLWSPNSSATSQSTKDYLESFRTRVGNKYDNLYGTVYQNDTSKHGEDKPSKYTDTSYEIQLNNSIDQSEQLNYSHQSNDDNDSYKDVSENIDSIEGSEIT